MGKSFSKSRRAFRFEPTQKHFHWKQANTALDLFRAGKLRATAVLTIAE